MKYELFASLYNEATNYTDVELFIAERAWQDWMNDYPADSLGDMLKRIYLLAHSTLKETREAAGYSRAKFAREYNIGLRTVEAWEYGQNKIADYTKMLIDYTFFTRGE